MSSYTFLLPASQSKPQRYSVYYTETVKKKAVYTSQINYLEAFLFKNALVIYPDPMFRHISDFNNKGSEVDRKQHSLTVCDTS